MKVSFAAIGITLSLIAATPASAEHKTWTGFSIGVGGGGGSLVSDLSVTPGTLVPPGLFSAGLDGIGADGAFGTVSAGLDYQINPQLVIGAFVDYDFADIATKFDANLFGTTINAQTKLEDVWTIGGRIGFLPSPSTLVYGLAGYSHASVTDLTITTSTGFTGVIGVPSFDGWTVGGGIETMIFKNVSLKGEYRYTQFDQKSLDLETLIPGASTFVDVKSEPSLQTGRVSINYKFNFGSN